MTTLPSATEGLSNLIDKNSENISECEETSSMPEESLEIYLHDNDEIIVDYDESDGETKSPRETFHSRRNKSPVSTKALSPPKSLGGNKTRNENAPVRITDSANYRIPKIDREKQKKEKEEKARIS